MSDAEEAPIARHVWETRYRSGGEATIEATWRRVAAALAGSESAAGWEARFLDSLRGFEFLPGGRILAGAGTGRAVTLCNCFVMGTIEDSIPGIFRALEEGAVTMQRGGGVGYDFSTLRPHGVRSPASGTIASGPVSFMDVWDAMCATIQSTGARRGAMMATLRCDHPDIGRFIDAKRRAGRLSRFNLSVLVTDALMHAVARDEAWPLAFPAGCVVRQTPARALWQRLLHASYDTGEPGVLFIDRINRLNNLWYCEKIAATNPCGEVPLPPYGACDLGSINLARLIRDPFTGRARLDTDRLTAIAATAVRLLDDVIDVSRYPLPQQREAAQRARRIGLGMTGLADALIMLGVRYGSDESLAFAAETMRAICHTAYRQSIAIACEKGGFPAFDRERYLAAPFVRDLPADIRDGIARSGIRNSHLLAIAPTGTISLLAGNVSSGIEPVFAADFQRAVLDRDGGRRRYALTDHAVSRWRQMYGGDGTPEALVSAEAVPIEAQIAMQAALQRYVDNAISKTIAVLGPMSFDAFASVYTLAYEAGLKGSTAFRSGAAGGVLAVGR